MLVKYKTNFSADGEWMGFIRSLQGANLGTVVYEAACWLFKLLAALSFFSCIFGMGEGEDGGNQILN